MTDVELLLREAGWVLALWGVNLVGLAAAEIFARRARLGPETARKLIHVTAGVLAIPLPWLLRSSVSMAVLAAGGLAALLACRRFGLLRSVHQVERSSLGDLLFPVGILLLFLVGHDDPPLYLIGLAYMVVADALAALIGRRYGRASYAVELQRKSLEGSVTFFVVSFLAAHLILLLGTDTPRLTSVLVAAQLAVLVTAFEAISTDGNDNLLVPVVTYLVAARLVELPPGTLGRDLLVQLAIGGLIAFATRRWRFAGASGAVTLALFIYGAYALGGVLWTLGPLVALAAYLGLRSVHWDHDVPAEGHHQVVAVTYVTVVGAILYLLVGLTGAGRDSAVADLLVAPYLGATAGGLGLLIYTLWRPWDAEPETLDPGIVPALVAGAVLATLAPWAPPGIRASLFCILLTPVLALAVYRRVRGGSTWPRAVPWNSRLHALSLGLALTVVTPLYLGIFTR